ncbi:MAG: NAD-dependent deacylase [Planctomycetaceae bacterium]|nr:NAD-dependent deacylase [Planctomycetaceae bacterium]
MTPAQKVASWLSKAKRAVAFTGAGISTESGIPDFRSPNGVWANNQPVYFDEFLRSGSAQYEYWRQKSLTHQEFHDAQPNTGHKILADWEQRGQIVGVITQNIDGLHQAAGSKNVWELHGTAREIGCLSCASRWPADGLVQQFLETDVVPTCSKCGGLLKHATVSFGQGLPEDVMSAAAQRSRQADLFLALGSSLVVYPAAGLPEKAKSCGARLVIINNTETPLDWRADLVIREGLGETLEQIDAALKKCESA